MANTEPRWRRELPAEIATLLDSVGPVMDPETRDLAASYLEHNEFNEAVDLIAVDLSTKRSLCSDEAWDELRRLAGETGVDRPLG